MLKVLIVEDDPIWQIKLQLMLEEFGYSAQTAGTLHEAHLYLNQFQPDLVLADVKLSDGVIFELFDKTPPQYPVIFVTEYADKTLLDKALAFSCASFYIKPFHSMTLLGAIKKALLDFERYHPAPKTLEVAVRYGQKKAIPFGEIWWIEVEGNYSTVQTKERKYVQKLSLPKIIPSLDERFVRINKSIIVNKKYIQHVSLNDNRVTVQQRIFEIGRSFRKKFIEQMYK